MQGYNETQQKEGTEKQWCILSLYTSHAVSEHLQTHWRVLMKGGGYTDIFRECQQRWKGAQEKLEDSCLKKEKMKKGRHQIFSYIWSTSSRIFLRYYNAVFFSEEKKKSLRHLWTMVVLEHALVKRKSFSFYHAVSMSYNVYTIDSLALN